jgi:CubicO group peptidase (beta-lactamase class C family)
MPKEPITRENKLTNMKKIIILLLLPLSIAAQKDYPSLLRQFMSGQHQYFHFNGNVLVAKDGKVLYQQALGYADLSANRMLNDSSVFELASLSKQFTAMSIMICKEKGLLSYNDNIKKFLSQLPYDNITIRNLLTHTSGLPSYESQFEKRWDHKKIAYNKDVVEMLGQAKDTLFFKPGSKWQYSNTGYALLASIIEKVSGMPYNDFLYKNIFRPLGMNHTFVYNSRRSTYKFPANYALGYVYSDSLKRYTLPDSLLKFDFVYYLDGIVGDGCVNSTTGDLFKWDRALYSNNLVSTASLNEMLSPLVPIRAGDTSTYYGYGVMVMPHTEAGKTISHTGGWPGYATMINRHTDKNETIIILSNSESNVGLMNAAIESILAGEDLIMPYEHREVKIDPAILPRYAGKYSAGLTLEFIVKDGKLYRHRNGTTDIELKPESSTKFFYGDGTDRQIEFEIDTNGKVTKTWFLNSGQKGEMKKIE